MPKLGPITSPVEFYLENGPEANSICKFEQN